MMNSRIKSDFSIQVKTLVEILQQRAKHQPNRLAYTFLEDAEKEPTCLTYQEVENKIKAIASHLQSLSSPGDRALLLYPSGLDFVVGFFACFYAGIIAVPAYPPKRNQKLSRLQTIVQDAEASLLLTTADIFQTIQQWGVEAEAFQKLNWVLTDQVTNQAEDFHPVEIEPDHIAFLQYTSGSTSTPKGVMVSHRNLVHNCQVIQHTYEEDVDSIVFSWLPPYHDMGLVAGIIQPIAVGCPSILMPPMSFLQDPMSWLKVISKYKVTATGG